MKQLELFPVSADDAANFYDWSMDLIAIDKANQMLGEALTARNWEAAKEASTQIVVLSRRVWLYSQMQSTGG